MKNLTSLLSVAVLGVWLVGCGAEAKKEPTAPVAAPAATPAAEPAAAPATDAAAAPAAEGEKKTE
ncbi:MAG: hypothetical protein U0992_15740 [Planctomycetaceae bacterium]